MKNIVVPLIFYKLFSRGKVFFRTISRQSSINVHRLRAGIVDIRNLLSSSFMRRKIALPFRYRNQIKSPRGRKHPRRVKKVKERSG